MKKLFLLAFVALSLAASAQTVDEVIAKYSEAIGGLDKFKALKSAKMSGNITVQGMELPITIQVLNNKAVRTDVEVMGTQVISAYQEGKGWKQNEFAGAPEPTDMTADEMADAKSQTQLINNLADYKTNGGKVELQGKEKVGETEAFKILFTSKEGKATTYYISSADYSLLKSVSTNEVMGQSMVVETYYSEPKLIDGLKFYMVRNSKIDGEDFQNIVFNNIELNVAVDEKIFNKP